MENNRLELNKNLAQMLKGGVIMDVTTPEQAKIAESAGACAVMALERIPADIRAAGGVPAFEIRQKADLKQPFDGLVIPGGESTVQGKLVRELGLFEDLKARIKEGLPVFGTCAACFCLRRKYRTMTGYTLPL